MAREQAVPTDAMAQRSTELAKARTSALVMRSGERAEPRARPKIGGNRPLSARLVVRPLEA
jgi:hypothetical protein